MGSANFRCMTLNVSVSNITVLKHPWCNGFCITVSPSGWQLSCHGADYISVIHFSCFRALNQLRSIIFLLSSVKDPPVSLQAHIPIRTGGRHITNIHLIMNTSIVIRKRTLNVPRLSITRKYTHNNVCNDADFAFTNDTPYLSLTGELWRVFREIFEDILPPYIESALHYVVLYWMHSETFLTQGYIR